MKIDAFRTEQWMNLYERQARHNLTDTSSDSLEVSELIKMDPGCLENLPLDYGWIAGDPKLREEILGLYENQDEKTLALSCGALQANEMVMSMLLEPGDEVITFTPGYQQYTSFPEWLGCTVREVPFRKEDWGLDFEAFKKALSPKTKLVVFSNPSNPTGTFLRKQELERLAALCRPYGTWILCDEVYRDPEDGSVSLSDLYEKGAATGSLSKMYGLAGLRTGWIKGPADLIEAVSTFRDYTIISTGPLSERLALSALKNRGPILERSRAVLEENRRILKDWLETTPFFSCIVPEHGPVAFLRLPQGMLSEPFARELLEETGIFFVPGSCFFCEGFVRLGLGKSHENFRAVLEQLDQFAAKYLETHPA